MSRLSDKEEYRKSYPSVRKWLNVCVVCQSEGHKPELPEKIHLGQLAENIRKFWPVLELSEIGICTDCSFFLSKK